MHVLLFLIFMAIVPLASCELHPSSSVRTTEEETLPSSKSRHLDNLRNRLIQDNKISESFSQVDVILQSNVISIQCSEAPLFFCNHNDKTKCGSTVLEEQDRVIQEIQSKYPDAKVVARTHKLINALFVELPLTASQHRLYQKLLLKIVGVEKIMPHANYKPQLQDSVEYIGATYVQEKYCATGRGVTVAVLDTGVDYTHEALDGVGTFHAYRKAFGRNQSSIENTKRDGLFPTTRVVEGYDFLGELYDETLEAKPDNDPIDFDGHGTLVASTIAAVAPDVELLAVKVCSIKVGCPQFAILKGFEYALDPNGDNSTNDKVDIINFSLTAMSYLAYYDMISLAVEEAFRLGVLSVVAAGNQGNKPYILTSVAQTPSAITCAATGHPGSNMTGVIEYYSSRGPGQNNIIKPDLAAPSRSNAAFVGTGNKYKRSAGTSFSTPLVAGSAALIKSQCRTCSPFAIKAILMNNASRNIKTTSNQPVPITQGGSGELRIDSALEADFWAFSPDDGDVQPSLSLGLINAAANVTIQRTIKVVSLVSDAQTLTVTSQFRDPNDEASGALEIVISPSEVVLTNCPGEVTIDIEFRINAANAPNNMMNSGGALGSDPISLDKNEFDGHILISSQETGKEIRLPFHALIRKAASVSVSTKTLPSSVAASSTVVQVENQGAGVAQLDAFELLVLSQDDPESLRGEDDVPSDLRAVGYRTLDVGEAGCSFLLEFAFTLWERPMHIVPHYVIAAISVGDTDFLLFNSGVPHRNIESKIINLRTNSTVCTGFPVDHATNTGNIVLRACAEHLGIVEARTIPVQFGAAAIPSNAENFTDSTDIIEIRVPQQSISAGSFNVRPGEVLQSFTVKQESGLISGNREALGLQLITNAYRSNDSTGAATRDTESIFFLKQNVTAPEETTPDTVKFPDAADTSGSVCGWRDNACFSIATVSPTDTIAPSQTPMPTFSPTMTAEPTSQRTPRPQEALSQEPSCPPNTVPRASISTVSPAPAASSSTVTTFCSGAVILMLLLTLPI